VCYTLSKDFDIPELVLGPWQKEGGHCFWHHWFEKCKLCPTPDCKRMYLNGAKTFVALYSKSFLIVVSKNLVPTSIKLYAYTEFCVILAICINLDFARHWQPGDDCWMAKAVEWWRRFSTMTPVTFNTHTTHHVCTTFEGSTLRGQFDNGTSSSTRSGFIDVSSVSGITLISSSSCLLSPGGLASNSDRALHLSFNFEPISSISSIPTKQPRQIGKRVTETSKTVLSNRSLWRLPWAYPF